MSDNLKNNAMQGEKEKNSAPSTTTADEIKNNTNQN